MSSLIYKIVTTEQIQQNEAKPLKQHGGRTAKIIQYWIKDVFKIEKKPLSQIVGFIYHTCLALVCCDV